MVAVIVVGVVLAAAVIVRVIIVARAADKGGVSHQWIEDNIYKRQGGDR